MNTATGYTIAGISCYPWGSLALSAWLGRRNVDQNVA